MASRVDTLLDAFWSNLDDPGVLRKKGRRAVAERGPLPRITFIPLGGSIVPPDLVGEGKLLALDGTESRSRILRVRQLGFAMVIQGQNEEQTEQLFHNAVATLEETVSGSLDFAEEQWPEQEEGQDGVERRGDVVLCNFTIYIPIYAQKKQLIRVSGWVDDDRFTVKGSFYGDIAVYGPAYKYDLGEDVACIGPSPGPGEALTDGGVELTDGGEVLTN